MKRICMFDARSYDKIYFDKLKDKYNFDITYYEMKLNKDSAVLAKGMDGVIAFVNDTIDEEVLDILYEQNIRVIAMRCSGYNNVDFKKAYNRVHILRVPAYSPYAIAEHAMAMILSLNRKLYRSYNRVRDYNFSLDGLIGFDMYSKTIGVIGTGMIGRKFINICKGFGMRILAYDPYPVEIEGVEYTDLEKIWREADVISLHCPLTKESKYLINKESIEKMKRGVYIINTSRGALIDTRELINGIKTGKIAAAGLDVYEEESEYFFEDLSDMVLQDDILARLISMPNVLITSHQAYLTQEALLNIAEITCENLASYYNEETLENEVCYKCINGKKGECNREKGQRCF